MKLTTLAAIALIVLSLIVIVRMVSFPYSSPNRTPAVHYTKSPPGPPTPDLPPTPDIPEPAIPGPSMLTRWPAVILPIALIGTILTVLQLIKESIKET